MGEAERASLLAEREARSNGERRAGRGSAACLAGEVVQRDAAARGELLACLRRAHGVAVGALVVRKVLVRAVVRVVARAADARGSASLQVMGTILALILP